jgi:hypothetical protein
MIARKDRKQEGKHDWRGSCSPENSIGAFRCSTFSVGIFQWVAKSGGKGLKRSAVLYRIKGYSSNPEAVYARAEFVCDMMDRGMMYLSAKSEMVNP